METEEDILIREIEREQKALEQDKEEISSMEEVEELKDLGVDESELLKDINLGGIEELQNKMNKAREEYLIALTKYNKQRGAVRKFITVLGIPEDKAWNSRLNDLKTDFKDKYDQIRDDMKKKMCEEKRKELESSGTMNASEIDKEITRYQANEVWRKVHKEEYTELCLKRAEKLPPNRKNTLQKAWGVTMNGMQKYSEIAKKDSTVSFGTIAGKKIEFTSKGLFSFTVPFSGGKKFDVTTGLLARSAAMGTLFAFAPWTAAKASYGVGTRIARGVIGAVVGGSASEMMRAWSEKKMAIIKGNEHAMLEDLRQQFGEGKVTPAEYEKRKQSLERNVKIIERGLLLARTGASLVLGYGVSMGVTAIGEHTPSLGSMAHNMENEYNKIKFFRGGYSGEEVEAGDGDSSATENSENQNTNNEQTELEKKAAEDQKIIDEQKAKVETEANETKAKAEEATKNLIETTAPIKIQMEGSSIEAVGKLKEQLADRYAGVDASKIPSNVQHMLDTDKYTLAKELGLFDPDNASGKESASFRGSLDFDGKGTLTINDLDAGETTVVSSDTLDTKKFHGNMIDTDNSAGADDTQKTNKNSNSVDTSTKEINKADTPTQEPIYPNVDPAEGNKIVEPEVKTPKAEDIAVPKSEHNIEIKRGAYEDGLGNVIQLEGKVVTLGPNHTILVDGVKVTALTEELQNLRGLILDKTFADNFAWGGDGKSSVEWNAIHEKSVEDLAKSTHVFNSDQEKEFFEKLVKLAKESGIDAKTFEGSADKLVDELAVKGLEKL